MSLLDNTPDIVEAPPPPKGGTGFYRARGYGFRGLGPVGTIIGAVLCVAGALSLAVVGFIGPLTVVVIGGIALAIASKRDRHGRTWADRHRDRKGWKHGTRTGSTSYQPSVLTDMGEHKLPGALATSRLYEYSTADGQPFGIIHYPTSKCYAVSARLEPDGASLLDENDLNACVENWGHVMASLAHEPDLLQAIVTIEVGPNSGPLMQATVRAAESPRAHSLSKQLMGKVLEQYPRGSQGVDVTFTLTFKAPAPEVGLDGKRIPRNQRVSEIEQIGELLGIRMPHLWADLPDCGLGKVKPLSADDLVEVVRTAFNPSDRGIYEEARAQGLARPLSRWTVAGPAGHKDEFSHYLHGGGASVTWESSGFTVPVIQADGLLPLLDTGGRGYTTRISLVLQPMDPSKAANLVENNYNASIQRVKDAKKPGARAMRAAVDADRARRSEANGHAVIDFATLVTVTVDDPSKLPQARAAVQRVGPNARLRLRVMSGQQAVGFAQNVGPLGLVIDRHLRVARALMNGRKP